jgi:hypothetical protein
LDKLPQFTRKIDRRSYFNGKPVKKNVILA